MILAKEDQFKRSVALAKFAGYEVELLEEGNARCWKDGKPVLNISWFNLLSYDMNQLMRLLAQIRIEYYEVGMDVKEDRSRLERTVYFDGPEIRNCYIWYGENDFTGAIVKYYKVDSYYEAFYMAISDYCMAKYSEA